MHAPLGIIGCIIRNMILPTHLGALVGCIEFVGFIGRKGMEKNMESTSLLRIQEYNCGTRRAQNQAKRNKDHLRVCGARALGLGFRGSEGRSMHPRPT